MLGIALDITDFAVAQRDAYASAAGAHVAGRVLDFDAILVLRCCDCGRHGFPKRRCRKDRDSTKVGHVPIKKLFMSA